MSYDPLEYHPRHYSMDELQQQIREGIALQGFAIRHVLSDGIHPPFSYTVGLYEAHAPFPELVISGLSMVTRNGFLLQLGYAMKGPPSPQVRRAMAQELGVRKKDLRIPSGGIRLSPGKIYRQFTGNGLPMCFAQVEQRYYLDLFGQAVVFHGHEHFPVFQMVWSDRQGIFPWAPSYERGPRFKQQLFFDPWTSLPHLVEKDTPSTKAR